MSSSVHQHHTEECPSCGSSYRGKFCNTCGEKVFHPSDLGIKKFLSQTVDIFTHFDSKFLRSLKYLMAYPGFLVKAYITGVRVKYAKPMQVFLLANIIFFFITHIVGVTDYTPNFGDHHYFGLGSYYLFQWAAGFDHFIADAIDRLGEWKQHELHLTDQQFYTTFYQNSYIYSKSFVILLIPMFAVVFWAFYAKTFKYFGTAIVFAIYFVSFQLLTFCIASFIYYGLHLDIYFYIRWFFFDTPLKYIANLVTDNGFEIDNIVFWMPYLYFAFQRVSKSNVWLTLAKSFIICKLIYFLTFGVYKKILIALTVILMHHV